MLKEGCLRDAQGRMSERCSRKDIKEMPKEDAREMLKEGCLRDAQGRMSERCSRKNVR